MKPELKHLTVVNPILKSHESLWAVSFTSRVYWTPKKDDFMCWVCKKRRKDFFIFCKKLDQDFGYGLCPDCLSKINTKDSEFITVKFFLDV